MYEQVDAKDNINSLIAAYLGSSEQVYMLETIQGFQEQGLGEDYKPDRVSYSIKRALCFPLQILGFKVAGLHLVLSCILSAFPGHDLQNVGLLSIIWTSTPLSSAHNIWNIGNCRSAD